MKLVTLGDSITGVTNANPFWVGQSYYDSVGTTREPARATFG